MAAEVIAGRFALCDPIGSGGSGTVWRAFDRKRGGYCAAKVLRQRAEYTVVTILGQVLSGLQAVHDAALIHRDVKPANLLLRATRAGPLHVVLTDFGLTISRSDARLTQVGTVIGTPGYLPPEVLRGGCRPIRGTTSSRSAGWR